jgi:hypothetical protein
VSTGRLHVCQRDGNTVEWRPFFAGGPFAKAGEDGGIVDGLILIAGRFSECILALGSSGTSTSAGVLFANFVAELHQGVSLL